MNVYFVSLHFSSPLINPKSFPFYYFRNKITLWTNDHFISLLLSPVEPLFQLFLTVFIQQSRFFLKSFVRENVEDSTEYLKNKTKKVTYLSFWDAAKAGLRGDLLLPELILGRGEKRNCKSS